MNYALGTGVPGVNEIHPCPPGFTGQSPLRKLTMTVRNGRFQVTMEPREGWYISQLNFRKRIRKGFLEEEMPG